MDLGIRQNEPLTALQAILSFFFLSLCSYHFFFREFSVFHASYLNSVFSAQLNTFSMKLSLITQKSAFPSQPSHDQYVLLTLPLACLVLQRCMDRSFSGLDYPWGYKSYFIPLLQILGGVRQVNMTAYAYTSIGSFLSLSVQVGQLCQTSHWSLDFRRRWFSTFLLNAPPSASLLTGLLASVLPLAVSAPERDRTGCWPMRTG